MRWVFILAGLLALAFAGTAIGMRLAPTPTEVWHLDPRTVTPPETPNFVLLRGEEAPTRNASVADLAAAVDAIARDDGARLIGGSLADGHMTYVDRTPLLGFPDAISVRIRETEDGSAAIDIFSRSCFGYSDMGVNAERIERWMSRLPS